MHNPGRADALRLTPVSRETAQRLDRLVDELTRWQTAKNLVAASTLSDVWQRHIADSLQLVAHAPETTLRWLDLGSGGGFPGLVIGAVLAERSGAAIDLVESNARKCAFLRHAARIMDIPARVHASRIEAIISRFVGETDVVTARALAPLSQLLVWTGPLIDKGTIGLFPKGQHVEDELTAAAKSWKIQASLNPSLTDEAARILIVRQAVRRSDS